MAACSGEGTTAYMDLSSVGAELALMGIFDAEDRLTQTITVELDAADRGALLFSLPEDGHVVALGLDRRALEARSPRVDWSRLEEIDFRPRQQATEACAEGVVAPDGRTAGVIPPAEAVVFAFDQDAPGPSSLEGRPNPFQSLEVVVPVAADRCAGFAPPRLRPFGDRPAVIRPGIQLGPKTLAGDTAPRLFAIERIDEARLLALHRQFLVVLERGQDFANRPGQVVFPGQGREFLDLAVGASVDDVGARRVVLLDKSASETSTVSRVLELSLVGTAIGAPRVLWESPTDLVAAYLTPEDGRLVVYQMPGTILAEPLGGGALAAQVQLPDREGVRDSAARFEASGLESHPVVLLGSHRGGIYVGNVARGDWRQLASGLEPGFSMRAFSTSPEPMGGQRLWTGNGGGFVYSTPLEPTNWERQPVRLDPRLIEARCANPAQDECGFGVPRHAWEHASPATDTRGAPVHLLFPDQCSVGFLLRADGCASHFSFAEGEVLYRDIEDQIVGAVPHERGVTLYTERASIYELELDP